MNLILHNSSLLDKCMENSALPPQTSTNHPGSFFGGEVVQVWVTVNEVPLNMCIKVTTQANGLYTCSWASERLSSPSSYKCSLWDGNSLVPICPVLSQCAHLSKTSLPLPCWKWLFRVLPDIWRTKKDPASLNWFCRPPLTSSLSSKEQFANSWTFKAEGLGMGDLCAYADAWPEGSFGLGSCWSHFGGRGLREGCGRGGATGAGNVAARMAFPFPLFQRVSYG